MPSANTLMSVRPVLTRLHVPPPSALLKTPPPGLGAYTVPGYGVLGVWASAAGEEMWVELLVAGRPVVTATKSSTYIFALAVDHQTPSTLYAGTVYASSP